MYVADTQNDRVRVFDGEKAERRHAYNSSRSKPRPQSFAQVTCARTASAASRVESRDRGRTYLLARTDGELSRREQRCLRAGRSPAPARSCLCVSTTSAASPCFRSAATFCAPLARRVVSHRSLLSRAANRRPSSTQHTRKRQAHNERTLRQAPRPVALPGRVASRSGRGAAGTSSCSSQRAARQLQVPALRRRLVPPAHFTPANRRGSAIRGGCSHRECRRSHTRAGGRGRCSFVCGNPLMRRVDRCSLRRASRAASHFSARRPTRPPTLSWTPLPPTRSCSRRSIGQLARLRRLYSGRLSAAGRGAGAALRSPASGELPSRPSASSCPLRARSMIWPRNERSPAYSRSL